MLTALGVGGWAVFENVNGCDGAFNDGALREFDDPGECVGVSDGSYVFAPELDAVSAKIREENRRVEESGASSVSFAYFIPMTLGEGDTQGYEAVESELQGAYLAQYNWNRTTGAERLVEPQVRLLLANPGAETNRWSFVVDELVSRVDGTDRLRAVIGMGPSFDGTFAALSALDAAGVPTAVAAMTANPAVDPQVGPPRYFARVGPTNAQEVAALANAMGGEARRPVLIVDVRADDTYTKTLADEFIKRFPALADTDEEYDSSLDGLFQTMNDIRNNICSRPPDVVLFAGRGRVGLTEFLTSLADRNADCRENPIRVVTGDDATETVLTDTGRFALAKAKVTVQYTALAHPSQWNLEAGAQPSVQEFARFAAAFETHFGGGADNDGHAMIAYDAALIAIKAVRLTGETAPTLEHVEQAWGRFGECTVVDGVTGTIALDKSGDALDKYMPLVALQPDGTSTFVKAAWPTEDGSPARHCD
ncbi:ABC transporter substrate-binding protein [Phytomonospora endophytica]|nr:ABC transporter substrate-binding protein [Phytomonospora endophytica]